MSTFYRGPDWSRIMAGKPELDANPAAGHSAGLASVTGPTVQREVLTVELWRELVPLTAQHWTESAIPELADFPLEPNQERYTTLEGAGLLRLFTVRSESGRLIGYLAALVVEHDYLRSLQADVLAVYVEPSARGRAGNLLLRLVDDAMRSEGVDVIRHRVKVTRDWSPVLLRMGYVAEDTTYSRRLR